MKEHTSGFKTQLKELGRQIRSQVIYGNTVLEEELFGVTPHYNGSILKSTMKQLDIETSVNIPLMTEVEYKLGLLVNNNWEWLSFGKYYVYKSEKMEDRDHYKLVCYDKLLLSMIPYVGVIGDFPMTLRDYLGEICSTLNITFASNGDEFCNYNRELPEDRYVGLSDYTYRDVLDEIAQATGSMICLNSDDELVVRYINEGIDNFNTIEGTSFTLEDASGGLGSSITELEGNTTQDGTPTPDNPVEIKTVSGDNEVVVKNKNFCSMDRANPVGNFNINNNAATHSVDIENRTVTVTPNISSTSANKGIYWAISTDYYKNLIASENAVISFDLKADSNCVVRTSLESGQGNIVVDRNVTTDWQRFELSFNRPLASWTAFVFYEREGTDAIFYIRNIQVEQNTQATSFEPYRTDSYRVDFGGKNLLRYSLEHLKSKNTSGTWNNNVYSDNGLTIKVKEDLSIEINGTSTAQEVFMLNNETMYFKTGTYYLSGCINGSSTTYDIRSYNYDGISSVIQEFTGKKAISIINNGQGFNIAIVVRSGQTLNNVMFYPMLDKSSVATPYSPYVSNPIELCKIGSYVDTLKRAEGKNYCYTNASEWELGQYGMDGNKLEYPQRARISTLIPVQPNTTIYVHTNNTNYNFVLRGYGQNKEIITSYGQVTNGNTITTTNVYYLGVTIMHISDTSSTAGQTILNNLGETIFPMICLNSETNKSYEPYGNNWYIEKNIGKVVLDSTYFASKGTTGTNAYYINTNITTAYSDNTKELSMCNMFMSVSFQNRANGLDNTYVQNGTLVLRTGNNTSYDWSTNDNAKAWLNSYKPIAYYVLSTPTYEIITNENLIQQLNNLQDIQLIENLCYVDWVGEESPTMTLKYYQGRTLEEINEEYLKDVNVDFGEKYGPVNSIVLSRSGESDNVYIQDEDSIEENGLHELKIVDNQLMNFNDRSDYLQGLLDKLDGLEYYINDYVSTGILYLDLGDRYYVHIGDNTYSCVMFNDEIDITLGLQELIHAEMLKESETDYTKADKTDRRINQTYLIVDKQNQTIQSVVNQIGDRSQKQTTITQDIDGINSEVSNLVDVTIEEQTSDNLIEIEGINTSQPIKLKIRPIGSSITYLYPRSNLYPSGSLYSGMRSVLFKRTYTENEDGEEVTKTENIYYELPIDLLYKDSTHYDEFELDYNEKICKVIKKLEYNSNGELVIKAVAETLYFDYPFIELKDGDYEISVPGYQYVYINVVLMKKNEYTTQFTTEVQVNTLIKQTEDEVMIQVNHKVDEDNFTKAEIIARINEDETSEAIINADAISLEGYTTINGGFSVDEEGNANIANGSVKINEEGIQLANGRSVVGGNGMLTQFQYNASGSVGHMQGANVSNQRIALYVPVYIPQNFVITETKLFITHTPAKVYEYTAGGYNEYTCYSRNVKLYKTTNRGTPQLNGGFIDSIAPASGELIYDFGSSSGKTFSSSSVENLNVSNLEDNLNSGMQYFYLADYVNNPSDWVTASRMSGMVDMTLYVTGFLQNNIE